MVASEQPGPVDVLAVDGRAPLLTPVVRRTVAVALVVALAAGWLVDRRVRAVEERAVGGCAAQASEAVSVARGRISSMVGYVRPTLFTATPGLRADLYRLVSGATQGTTGPVAEALAGCRSVRVLPIHGATATRRADCLTWLERELRFVDAVARDGRAAFGPGVPGGSTTRSAAACAG
ncbi:MAG: hypothetical protein ACTHKG_18530 [Nocardioides sp.]